MTTYIALLRKERNSDFGVEFPDFPGCITAGKTLQEARRMAAEAIELHIKGMVEDHRPIPEPSTLDAIMDDPVNRSAVAFLVEVATGDEAKTAVWRVKTRMGWRDLDHG